MQKNLGATALAFVIFFAAINYANSEDKKVGEVSVLTSPFDYCAAVVNDDNPVQRFAGQAMPEEIVDGIRKAVNLGAEAPEDWIARGTYWRCMDGSVYACFVGVNLPCDEKADTSREPSSAMLSYCNDNQSSGVIPAVVAGRASMYEWRCRSGVPEIIRQISKPDARGFLSTYWYRLDRPVSVE
ncbi:hypothetical protein ACJJIW_19665 [Microbulbifer sp. JMSA004]|uniref:hypothetical protein n=1 Tax=Microbulbifer sp. JMSA004 TaxID=3243370 RepID=UPI0040397A30